MANIKLGIFKGFDKYYKHYIDSCEELNIDYEVIDLLASNWMEQVQKSDCDGFLCRPPSKFQERKSMFDERLYVINKMMNRPIYPSYDELFIYENKRMMSYWLKLHNFPHPETHVFYRRGDALAFIKQYKDYPLVFKSNVGSTAKGVTIVKSKWHARRIIFKTFGLFTTKLASGYTSVKTGKVIPWTAYGTRERHFVIAQKFEKIKWEWRIIKIDESYFGHKKLLRGNFASGSQRAEFVKPPDELMFLIKDICERGNFYSMDADIFETVDGRYLVNELQSIFLSKKESQMEINNIPGRFIYNDEKFVFEEGVFNRHGSYLLRVKHFVKILSSSKK